MAGKIALSIGILRSGSLPELPGALAGSKEFSSWADKQGYKTHLVTDEQKPVKIKDLKDLVKTITDVDEPERLLIYFAGHGFQPSINTAYWLLSDWEQDSDEAVNLSLSFNNAKRSGIRQISVFSDACRTGGADAATVGGSSLFPKPAASMGKLPQWDQFFASRLGESAQEVSAKEAIAAYGIFSRCLMKGLSGAEQDAIENRSDQSAVTSGRLANFLEEAVPLESGKLAGARVQFPEVISGWRSPDDVYFEIPKPTGQSLDRKLRVNNLILRSNLSPLSWKIPEYSRRDYANVARAKDEKEKRIDAIQNVLSASRGRASFETRTGLTVIGARPTRLAFQRNGSIAAFPQLFEENGAWHIRGHSHLPQSVLIELDNGNWIGTCMIPQFVGTSTIINGVAASLSFSPANNGQFDSYSFEAIEPALNRWTALMTQGRVGDYKELAENLRQYKHQNPSFGILAGYAYERAGLIKEIDSIARLFIDESQFVPFDVAMLSTIDFFTENSDKSSKVAGNFPLLSQGWAFLDPVDHPSLTKFRSGLISSLWTTFSKDAGNHLADVLGFGVI